MTQREEMEQKVAHMKRHALWLLISWLPFSTLCYLADTSEFQTTVLSVAVVAITFVLTKPAKKEAS